MSTRPTVKDLLADSKDVSELMVDLAYAAVFFGDNDIAQEVMRLRETLTERITALRTLATLAARSLEDAEGMAGVLALASSVDKIGDAAEDIARVVLKDLGVPVELRSDLRQADEVVMRVRLRPQSALEGQSLADAEIPTETGMWLIAIRRDVSWIFGPNGDEVLHPSDVIFAQGPAEGVDLLRGRAGAPPLGMPADVERTLTGLERAVDLLVEMKDASEVAVGLAYSSVLLQDKGLAAEVGAIEDTTDEMHHELERWVLHAVKEGAQPETLRGLLHLAFASERIADAAQEMTRIIENDDAPHPIIAEALAEADEIVVAETVVAASQADGRSLRALKLRTEIGMEILAVQRGGRWNYRPRSAFTFSAGDRAIAVGSEDGHHELINIFGVITDG